jgi:RNA polymerase sigma factor (TIGR02999 family)
LRDRFGSEKPKLPQGKPEGFMVVVELNGGVQREVLKYFVLFMHCFRRTFALHCTGHKKGTIKLSDDKDFRFENRAHLIATVARAIRRLLVDHSRSKNAAKRGRHWNKQEFDEAAIALPLQYDQWADLDEALEELEKHDVRLSKLVELRFFGGMTLDEAADSLGMSRRTIASDWALARAWLRRRLENEDE